MRRVVTGHSKGKAVFVSDADVAPTTITHSAGSSYHELWSSDAAPTFPDDGSEVSGKQWFPPVGGYRFATFTVPPQSAALPADFDRSLAAAEIEAKLPGMLTQSNQEPDSPGMHTSDTIDFEYVISGEVWLELDDGAEVCLQPGDTVVQNGTRHRWVNKGTQPCTMIVFLTGARRSE